MEEFRTKTYLQLSFSVAYFAEIQQTLKRHFSQCTFPLAPFTFERHRTHYYGLLLGPLFFVNTPFPCNAHRLIHEIYFMTGNYFLIMNHLVARDAAGFGEAEVPTLEKLFILSIVRCTTSCWWYFVSRERLSRPGFSLLGVVRRRRRVL